MTYHQDSALAEAPAKADASAASTASPPDMVKAGAKWGALGALATSGVAAKAQLTSDRYPCPIILSAPQPQIRLAVAATFGYSEALINEIYAAGYKNWLGTQLAHTKMDEWHKFEKNLSSSTGYDYDTIHLQPCTAEADASICPSNGANRNRVRRQLVRARIIRALYSPAQVFERMVEFWTDHLNTWHNTPGVDRMKTFEDQSIREHALGNLSDLLYASATSPAMLKYLDGNVNVAGNPNENYARELLELHTLGADVCYDETTIEVLARALTGWEVNLTGGTCCGEVTFNDAKHDNNPKVLVFPGCGSYLLPANSGQAELGLVIDILTDPNKLGRETATFIASKLATYFISCNPKPQMINEMVNAYAAAYGTAANDISAMVSVMLSERWIRCTENILKRPLLLMTSALRATEALVTDPGFAGDANAFSLVGDFLTPAGHVPYGWPAPDGYPAPCDTDYWASNLLPRWSLGASIANDEFDFVDINNFVGQMSGLDTPDQVVYFLNQRLFAGFWPYHEFTLVANYLDTFQQPLDNAAKRLAIGLAIGSPSFSIY